MSACPTCGADLDESRHYDAHRYEGCPALANDDETPRRLEVALEALRWIAEHRRDSDAIRERGTACDHPFHTTRPPDRAGGHFQCPECCSQWWDIVDGWDGMEVEGDHTLGAVAAKALAEIEAM